MAIQNTNKSALTEVHKNEVGNSDQLFKDNVHNFLLDLDLLYDDLNQHIHQGSSGKNSLDDVLNKSIFVSSLSQGSYSQDIINYQDESGKTVLHLLAQREYDDKYIIKVAEKLVNAGADYFIKDNEGKTAAMLAKKSGKKGLKKLLSVKMVDRLMRYVDLLREFIGHWLKSKDRLKVIYFSQPEVFDAAVNPMESKSVTADGRKALGPGAVGRDNPSGLGTGKDNTITP